MRLQGLKCGHRDCLVSTFLREDIEENRGGWPAVGVPIEIDNIIKVARSRPFSECSQFLSEGFLVGIAIRPDTSFGAVGIGVKYFATHGGKYHPLVRRQIELDLGPAARSRRNRSSVTNLALAIGPPAGVGEDIKFELVRGNDET